MHFSNATLNPYLHFHYHCLCNHLPRCCCHLSHKRRNVFKIIGRTQPIVMSNWCTLIGCFLLLFWRNCFSMRRVYRATGSRSPYAKAATASRRRRSWKENWEKRLYIHLNTCFSLIAVSYQYTMQHLCGEWHWNKNYQHRSYCTNILYLTSPDSNSDITITGDGVDDVFCVCLRWIMECTR